MTRVNYPDNLIRICTPSILADSDNFLLKLADCEEEILAAQRLRYQVFKMEQGRMNAKNTDDIDQDEFDEYCLHLVVLEKHTGTIVGTYRIQHGLSAIQNIGFYSEREYRIDQAALAAIAESALEVGRSCVDPQYRNGVVVSLLWSGLAEIQRRSRSKYILGCVSLESTNPCEGWALYEMFKRQGILSSELSASPQDGYELLYKEEFQSEIEQLLADSKTLRRSIPPLFKGYLRLGVNICGVPAFDEEFGSIDFLILLNFESMPEKYCHHYNI